MVLMRLLQRSSACSVRERSELPLFPLLLKMEPKIIIKIERMTRPMRILISFPLIRDFSGEALVEEVFVDAEIC